MMVLELPDENDPDKAAFCEPLRPEELLPLLPDADTVLVLFQFFGGDLLVLPVRRDLDGAPSLIHTRDGYFRVPNAGGPLRELADVFVNLVGAIDAAGLYAAGAAELARQLRDTAEAERRDGVSPPLAADQLWATLGERLRLADLLRFLEPDEERRRNLHLILLPDGPLFNLPLHDARVGPGGPPLLDAVASLRYGLGLRPLEIQVRIERERHDAERDVALRGSAFVHPDSAGEVPLPGTVTEVENLLGDGDPPAWRVFGEHGGPDERASRDALRRHHRTPNLLYGACHGGPAEDTFEVGGNLMTVVNPALHLSDGPVSTARMAFECYDFRPVMLTHFSCCLLGRLDETATGGQVEGFIAALVLLGARRVCSALWELSDEAAAAFAGPWLAALRRHVFRPGPRSPHAFAVAFKEAVTAFRAAGTYDHEFYWAPYTLYGLG